MATVPRALKMAAGTTLTDGMMMNERLEMASFEVALQSVRVTREMYSEPLKTHVNRLMNDLRSTLHRVTEIDSSWYFSGKPIVPQRQQQRKQSPEDRCQLL